jgi:hypothetical protein
LTCFWRLLAQIIKYNQDILMVLFEKSEPILIQKAISRLVIHGGGIDHAMSVH